MIEGIIKQTVNLQSQLVFQMEENLGKMNDKEIEEELKRKREITLANNAVDEVKGFLKTQLIFVFQMYTGAFLDEEDLRYALKEDLIKLIINVIINEDLYKVLVSLYRIDNFELDKDLRLKYSALKGVKTTDFEIDPYLSLA